MSQKKKKGSALKILLILQIVIIVGLAGTIGYFLLSGRTIGSIGINHPGSLTPPTR